MPKTLMGWAKFAVAVGASILVLEKTGVLDWARKAMAGTAEK